MGIQKKIQFFRHYFSTSIQKNNYKRFQTQNHKGYRFPLLTSFYPVLYKISTPFFERLRNTQTGFVHKLRIRTFCDVLQITNIMYFEIVHQACVTLQLMCTCL